MMRRSNFLAITIALAALLLGTWRPDRPRYCTLDEWSMLQVEGQSSLKMKYRGDCAQFSLGANEVVSGDCPGNEQKKCISCDLGYYGAIDVASGGNGYLVGQYACEIAKKFRGTCINGNCENAVNVGFCSGTPDYYNDQS